MMMQTLQTRRDALPEPGAPGSLFGEELVAAGLITPDQLRIALHEQQRRGGLLGRVLCRLGALDEADLCRALAERAGWRSIAAAQLTPDLQLLRALPHQLAADRQMLPLRLLDGVITLACADPYDIVAQDQLRAHFGAEARLEFVLAPGGALAESIARSYGAREPAAAQHHAPESGEVRLWLTRLLQEAVECGASDIHLEPQPHTLNIRFRRDGMLRQIKAMHRDFWPPLLQRLKISAGVNIAETRKPQDGRFSQQCGAIPVDFRIAFMPTVQGEAASIRILDPRVAHMPLAELGFDGDQIASIRAWLRRPDGLLLVTGPTGSGKSTTLHAMLRELDRDTRNIMTLEDPVEYQFEGMRQTQVREQYGLGFAEGVRSILRHDPDVILIGEIRDGATAQQAVRAAMTGHLVLSTLHTGNAWSVVPRLLDLGVPRALLPGHLRGAVAQRLVRKLCPHCRAMRPPAGAELAAFPPGAPQPLMLGVAHGCAECFGTGRRGRTLVAEVLEFTPAMLETPAPDNPSPSDDAMWRHGLAKSCTGMIAFDDLMAAIPKPDQPVATENRGERTACF